LDRIPENLKAIIALDTATVLPGRYAGWQEFSNNLMSALSGFRQSRKPIKIWHALCGVAIHLKWNLY